MKRWVKRALAVLTAGLLCLSVTGCGASGSVYDTRFADGTQAQLTLENGEGRLASLKTEDGDSCTLLIRDSITGPAQTDGDSVTISYTTRYHVDIYVPLSDSAEDVLAAAAAYEAAKPFDDWKSADPVSSQAFGESTEDGVRVCYNDDTYTLSWEYTAETAQTARIQLAGDSFETDFFSNLGGEDA